MQYNVSDIVNIEIHIIFHVKWSLGNGYVKPVGCYGSFILIVSTPNDDRWVRFQPLYLNNKYFCIECKPLAYQFV